jgi:CDP-glucose 4,6-dehydratase
LIDFRVFRGKRILLTGHSGFKGSWLLAILEQAGATVRGLSLPPLKGSHFEDLGYLETHGGSEFFDIREFATVKKTISDFNPEVIFHLAAQPLVRESFRSTRETFEVNVMGGVNILEAARDAVDLRAIVFITSDKAYENLEWEWGYRENDQLGGVDPYSASKGAVEIVVAAYRRSVLTDPKLQLSTVRAGNVIGGGDWSKDRLVPDIVRSVMESTPAVIRNPNSTRPWQHVLEPLSGYLLLAQRMLEGEEVRGSYNFGPDTSESRSVISVARGLLASLGKGDLEIVPDSENLHEAGVLQLNCDRAKFDLGWAPRWDFRETLEMTGTWYKNHMSSPASTTITAQQIKQYFKELP